MKIDLFLKSITAEPDYEARICSCRNHFAPALMRRVDKQFDGRLLDSQSVALLYDLEAFLEQQDGDVRIYDTSKFTGWLKGLLGGVRELPTVVVDGEKHSGFKEAKRALAAWR